MLSSSLEVAGGRGWYGCKLEEVANVVAREPHKHVRDLKGTCACVNYVDNYVGETLKFSQKHARFWQQKFMRVVARQWTIGPSDSLEPFIILANVQVITYKVS